MFSLLVTSSLVSWAAPPCNLISPRSEAQVTSGDLNGDGRPDLVFAPQTNNGGLWFVRGTAAGFAQPVAIVSTGHYQGPLVADFDADGLDDVAYGLDYFEGVELRMNLGQGFASPIQLLSYRATTRGMEAADVDGDGDLDLLVWGSSLTIVYNLGGGSWVSQPLSTDGYYDEYTGEFSDIDGDGDPDIVMSHYYLGSYGYSPDEGVWWLENPGWGRTKFHTDTFERMDVADLDQDGFDDVILAGLRELRWLRNQQGTGFSSPKLIGTYTPPYGAPLVRVTDLDVDGRLDIMGLFVESQFQLWLGDGLGTFQTRDLDLPGSGWTESLHLVDVGGDGDLDVVYGMDDGLFWCQNRRLP